jgi:uncharacterized membrane protein YdbT with pleckstrin-like domain
MNPETTPPPQHHYFQGIMLEPGEEVVTVIHRHPVGIVGIVLVGLGALAAMVALLMLLLPDAFTNSDTRLSALGIATVLLALASLMLLAAIFVYRQSRIMVTNKNLVQIMQKTLFNKKISRLSMSNVEDVNAEQRGILATIFNFGTLLVQTAGEKDNFSFTLCPNPNKYAEQILEAREAYANALRESNENR